MSKIQVIYVEMDKCQDSLPQWAEALSTHVGRVLPSVRDQEVIRCSPIGLQRFAGRIEFPRITLTCAARAYNVAL